MGAEAQASCFMNIGQSERNKKWTNEGATNSGTNLQEPMDLNKTREEEANTAHDMVTSSPRKIETGVSCLIVRAHREKGKLTKRKRWAFALQKGDKILYFIIDMVPDRQERHDLMCSVPITSRQKSTSVSSIHG